MFPPTVPGVADLRRADFARRVDDGRIQPLDLRVFGQVGDLHAGADLQAAVRRRGDRRVGELLTLTTRSGDVT